MKIEKYPHNRWLNKWVTYNNGKKFEWLISPKIPCTKFWWDFKKTNELVSSGLSKSSKVIFFYLIHNRFGDTPACLYGNGYIAKKTEMTESTAKKALDELITCSIINKVKIHTGLNVSYQYYFRPYVEWNLPSNRYDSPEMIDADGNTAVPIETVEI